jgi:hypothetical protein
MNTINLTKLAGTIQAYKNCIASNNTEWQNNHLDAINAMNENLPHGSGIDGKCDILLDCSTDKRILVFVEFHHMDETGYYDGWTEHILHITPTFGSFNIRISGKDKNGIKNYLSELFYSAFTV